MTIPFYTEIMLAENLKLQTFYPKNQPLGPLPKKAPGVTEPIYGSGVEESPQNGQEFEVPGL